ncbi:NUDIX domain-containing protein [Chelativorans xinjiangense]|uniref:NUDIX domain-containing protein n=1 Tax=Chelativorans xinjiangense TaxID=2681485 RepID=UPI0013574D6A|nr:NUDIX domain-containing protein [Chelativorans xinjiangense]
MARKSAGILPFRRRAGTVQVLLVHPGGPFWRKRDDGVWSIAKGEYGDDEQAEAAARREFTEETGWQVTVDLMQLGETRQAGGKYVTAFAVESDFDPTTLRSNVFEMEWPPRSGRMQSFPEIDRAEWFSLEKAREKLLAGQRPYIERLVRLLQRRPNLFDAD